MTNELKHTELDEDKKESHLAEPADTKNSAVDHLSLEEQIKVLKVLDETQRTSQESKDWYDNLKAGKTGPKFVELSKEEARKHLYGPDAKPHWSRDSGHFFCVEEKENGEKGLSFDIYAISPNAIDESLLKKFKEETGLDPLLFIAQHLHRPAQKYEALLQKNGLSDQIKYRIRIQNQKNLSTFGSWMVDVGGLYINDILSAVLEKDYAKYQNASTSLESQYFHELIHIFNDKEEIDNGTSEELTMLAEFLYDPENNTERNKQIFSVFAEHIFDEERVRAEGKWYEAYDTPYQKVTSRILLWELVQKGKIKAPLTPEAQQKILLNINLFYSTMPENERDEILQRYVTQKRDDLYALGEEIDKKLSA